MPHDVIDAPTRAATASRRSELECGHRQPVKPGNGTTWCPPCGELRLVRSHPSQT